MANENLIKLQTTTNRFASAAGFSPLVIDGGMGAKTEAAITKTLQFIAGGCKGSCAADVITKAVATDALKDISQTTIMQKNVALNDFFTGAASKLSMPPPATVVLTKPPSGDALPDRSVVKVMPPAGASFWESSKLKFRQMPQWQQAGLGIGGGIALLIAFTKFRGNKSKAR
jgi:hypothetical protein